MTHADTSHVVTAMTLDPDGRFSMRRRGYSDLGNSLQLGLVPLADYWRLQMDIAHNHDIPHNAHKTDVFDLRVRAENSLQVF